MPNKDSTGNERYMRWYNEHKEEVSQLRKEKYEELKSIGLCPRCGGDREDREQVLCLKCSTQINEKKNENRKKGDK